MSMHECAGSERKKPNVPEDVSCPGCGAEVEIWTYDKKVTCLACSKEITREELGG